jgi:hypothetical protein
MKRSAAAILMILLFAVCIASARTWYVTPDGTGDAPTIQAGIDSAWSGGLGGFVVVASGTYYESGIQMRSRVILESETGDPDDVTIDAQWHDTVMYCDSLEARTTVAGLTFARGLPSDPAGEGGGIRCRSGSPIISNCVFRDNVCLRGGGAHGPHAGIPSLNCCDIFGNAGGDWVGCVTQQHGTNGNFSACPSFCHAAMGDFHLCDDSPCLRGNRPDGYDCHQIGAWGQGCGCGPSHTEVATWGAIKSVYR